jgi:phosphoribosyl-ATP pyrophosphohydrolase/phosphoribosyl-AMP cyclohydrolase
MNPNFEKGAGLIPAIVQHEYTLEVLMLGYMTREALDATLNTRKVTFFSRSKNRLWVKGESSGNYLNLISITEDCDRDTLLIRAVPVGPVCHTGSRTCFGEPFQGSFLRKLEVTISDRKAEMPEHSYTSQLFNSGINKIAQKVGEEAVELVIESLGEDREQFINEAADLLFHTLVLLSAKNIKLSEVEDVLAKRNRQK